MFKFSAVSQIWKKYIQKLNDWDLPLILPFEVNWQHWLKSKTTATCTTALPTLPVVSDNCLALKLVCTNLELDLYDLSYLQMH